jgi:Bacterial PH domain
VTAVDDGSGGPDPAAAERPSGAWSPSAGLVGVAWAATAAAVSWCVLDATTGDRAGLLMAAVAALGLGLAALFGTRARPRLRVDASGVTVGGLAAPRHHPWSEVGDVRVLTVRRLGRTSTVLEIDVVGPDDERLFVFGRLDLDDDPVDVAEAVRAVRAHAAPG